MGATSLRFIKKVVGRGPVAFPSEVRHARGIGEVEDVEFEVVMIHKTAVA